MMKIKTESYVLELERKLRDKWYQYHKYGGRRNLRRIEKLQQLIQGIAAAR